MTGVRDRTYRQGGELTADDLRQLEGRWKSDVDLKLDRLVAFADKYDKLLDLLLERETSRAELRKAVLHKTAGALVWVLLVSAVVTLGMGLAQWLKNATGIDITNHK